MAEEIAAIPGAADESAFLAAQKTPEGFVAAVNTSCRINGWGVESSYYRPSYMVLLITGDDGGKIRKLVEIPKRSEPPSLAVSVP
jgi:hypothetical protein